MNRHRLRQAEENSSDCVGLKPGAAETPYKVRSLDVPVEVPAQSVRRSHANSTMNELEIKNTSLDADPERHIVLVHGYGASKGYFYRNFKAVAGTGTVHALDWLGYGSSTRAAVNSPRFKHRRDGVLYAEDWFVTASESWRKQRGIEKFTLVAHSLGAPISCSYASQYPERIEKLASVSPASVNRTRYSIPADESYAADKARPEIAPVTGNKIEVTPWFNWMWEHHWSPFSLVRVTGPWGPKSTSGWTSRRFSGLPPRDQKALQFYSYTMFNAKGSGEYSSNYFLTAGSASRWPLVERLQDIKCPTLWSYGDKDWMDVEGGEEAVQRSTAQGSDASLRIVKNSGHHSYLDNIPDFNEYLTSFLSK